MKDNQNMKSDQNRNGIVLYGGVTRAEAITTPLGNFNTTVLSNSGKTTSSISAYPVQPSFTDTALTITSSNKFASIPREGEATLSSVNIFSSTYVQPTPKQPTFSSLASDTKTNQHKLNPYNQGYTSQTGKSDYFKQQNNKLDVSSCPGLLPVSKKQTSDKQQIALAKFASNNPKYYKEVEKQMSNNLKVSQENSSVNDNILQDRAPVKVSRENFRDKFGNNAELIDEFTSWSQKYDLEILYQNKFPKALKKYDSDIGDGICKALSNRWCKNILIDRQKQLQDNQILKANLLCKGDKSIQRLSLLEYKIDELVYDQKIYENFHNYTLKERTTIKEEFDCLQRINEELKNLQRINEEVERVKLTDEEFKPLTPCKLNLINQLNNLTQTSTVSKIISEVSAIEDNNFASDLFNWLVEKARQITEKYNNLKNQKLEFSKIETNDMNVIGKDKLPLDNIKAYEIIFQDSKADSATGTISMTITNENSKNKPQSHRIAFSIDKTSEYSKVSGLFFDPNVGEILFEGRLIDSLNIITDLYNTKNEQTNQIVTDITFQVFKLSHPKDGDFGVTQHENNFSITDDYFFANVQDFQVPISGLENIGSTNNI
ncbi:MAG: hypothetical protein EOP33_06660 [Rickettsiaceae bacterium]|nr:MAG: hypothetical protein EOP33_06660 [Rickettsiaceae bacterium]